MTRSRARRPGSFLMPGWALVACLCLATCGCEQPQGEEDGRPVVVVSIPPLGYFVERLAGDAVRIEVLIPPGASPHTYEPTIEQMRSIERTRLYVQIGHPALRIEGRWLERLVANDRHPIVVSCAEGIVPVPGDPHVWLSPMIMRAAVPRMAAGLIALDPGLRHRVEDHQQRLVHDIDTLVDEIRTRFANLEKRRFWVFHPAWAYFARDFDLEQVAIESGHREPDPKKLGELIAQARAEGVRELFVQPQTSRRSAELVAGEIGATVVSIDPMAADWLANLRRVSRQLKDAMSA